MKFKKWLIQEKAFDSKGSDFSKSPSMPMGFGDLRQMRRWSYMGRPTQPDWQRAAASAVGGFGDAVRDTMANIGIRPGAPAHWPGDEEYEDSFEVEITLSKEQLGLEGDMKDINPEVFNSKNIRTAFSDKAYEIITSGRAELDDNPDDYDLTRPKIFDISFHENNGRQGLRASISYPPKKSRKDKFPDYQTRADQDRKFGAKRGIGNQSVPNPHHSTGNFSYRHDSWEKDTGR